MPSFCNHTIRDVRIGNDLMVRWRILTNGEAFPLADRNLTLTLWHAFGKREITNFETLDNVLYRTFPATEQRHTGEYILTLIENKGLPGMATLDQKGFRLVGRMFGENGLVQPTELDLETSDFVVGAGIIQNATEYSDGLMPKEDKQLINQLRQTIIDLDDEEIRSWFYPEVTETQEYSDAP